MLSANINIGPRMQGFRYLHGRITGSLEIGTLIQSIAEFSPRCIIKQLKHIIMQYIKKITEKHQPCSSTINNKLQWVIFHIHILKLKGCNPPFEVSKVGSTYHIINATIQTIEYWIRRTQCHRSYVENVSDTMPCLKTTFLMWYQAICGEFCFYRELPAHWGDTGEPQVLC